MQKKLVNIFFLIGVCLISESLSAQDGMQILSLQDLSSFKPQAGNWHVVGSVFMDRNVDIHSQILESTKIKKKKGTVESQPKVVTFSAGAGILLNQNTTEKKDALLTTWEHGDIELELEVMLPKGSNSGIYLQGRYEIQLFDSWGVKNPSFSDIGGIYRNWESDPETQYMGKAPLTNAAKAPGLWQELKISFTAPKFDASGNKIRNARFNYVDLNGVRIHENIEVPQMTGGSISNKESATGPLMIQGDHGPVALKNIRYKQLNDLDFNISDLTYDLFIGKFNSVGEVAKLRPTKQGETEGLTWEMAGDENEFTVWIKGFLEVPADDSYLFTLSSSRHAQLTIHNQVIEQLGWAAITSNPISLNKGKVPFELFYFKDEAWFSPKLGLSVQTANTHPKALQTFNSLPLSNEVVAPIYLNVGSEPKLLRAFLDFKGERNQRLTHTIGVGDPSGTHYIYDMQTGSIACVWKGDFVDATPMWHDRGDGSFRPRGVAQYLYIGAALVNAEKAPFSKMPIESFKGKGYFIDATGKPVFKYTFQNIVVTDKAFSIEEGKILRREITLENPDGTTFYYKLAEGNIIVKLPDGSYLIDGSYYITSSAQLEVRTSNGKSEIICPITNQLQYDIIW